MFSFFFNAEQLIFSSLFKNHENGLAFLVPNMITAKVKWVIKNDVKIIVKLKVKLQLLCGNKRHHMLINLSSILMGHWFCYLFCYKKRLQLEKLQKNNIRIVAYVTYIIVKRKVLLLFNWILKIFIMTSGNQ